MRALLYAASVSTWAFFLAACLSAPKPEQWLAVGYRTPEQTFRTFQTGLRGEWPDLEYLCLGDAFKHRSAITELTYREVRAELFRREPWLKLAARAKVKQRIQLPDGRVRLVAEVDTWFHDETFAVDFAPEEFYELYTGAQRVDDAFVAWRELAREKDGQLVVSVPLPSGLGVQAIGELRAGREWKIDGFPLLDASGP